jgi:hypothetical protein
LNAVIQQGGRNLIESNDHDGILEALHCPMQGAGNINGIEKRSLPRILCNAIILLFFALASVGIYFSVKTVMAFFSWNGMDYTQLVVINHLSVFSCILVFPTLPLGLWVLNFIKLPAEHP